MGKYIPFRWFKTVLRDGSLGPNFNSAAGRLNTVNKGFRCWDKKRREVVKLSKAGVGYGPVSVLYVCIDMDMLLANSVDHVYADIKLVGS